MMTTRLPFAFARPFVAFLSAAVLTLTPGGSAGEVEILRDSWGIPHIFAPTDAGAFYGLGYATAEDRAFQMTYSLRVIQGRLSEVIGQVGQGNRRDNSVDHDRKMRTFGFHRAALRTAANLDRSTLDLLEAYCDGVNAWFRGHANDLPPLFARTGLQPEPWTPADCLASWWHLGQFFATDGTRDLIAGRSMPSGRVPGRATGLRPGSPTSERGRPQPGGSTSLEPLPPDDAPAVAKRSDLPVAWMDRVNHYARDHGLMPDGGSAEGPKFSHAWVVGGKRTTTGSSVLVSDPQTPVRNPSVFYEFHLQGRTFNARGIGASGSPILLIGFTDRVAWGVTALGADQADLFQLETEAAHPDQYRFDGEWHPMTTHREMIRIKGRDPIEYLVRETHLGPVATPFCFAQPGEGEVALKRIPVCDTNRETIQGAIAMMRARNAREFDAALAGWRFPSANVVFGDREGSVGYRAVAAIPVRSRFDPTAGRHAQPGHRQEQDWQEILPADLLPGVLNPAAGFLYSGNHRPIESWYPIPLGTSTGAGGDTIRSWRLRECLEARERFTPEDVRAIHFDAVNPARRDLVRLALHLRDALRCELSAAARLALNRLEPWYRAGASSSLDQPGAELALELNTFFRIMSTDLAQIYGGGEPGLAYFLKTATARIRHDARAAMSDLEQDYVDRSLASAWQSAQQKYGPDPEAWLGKARAAVIQQRLGYYESLDGFPALDPTMAVAQPALRVTDGGTIGCQTAQSYTQWVPMHDPDQAQSLLPIGQSERADRASRTNTWTLWGEGRLHPAPLSRAAVERLAVSRTTLRPPTTPARRTWHVRDFGAVADGRTDSGEAIRATIEAALRSGPGAKVVLEAGTYRVKPAVPREACFPIRQATNLLIQGIGRPTKIVLTDPAAGGFSVQQGAQVVLRDFTLDYDPVPFCQGRIRAVDVRAGSFDLEVEEGYPTPDAENFVRAIEPYGKWGMIMDRTTRRIRSGTPDHYMTPRWEQRGDRVWRFFTADEHHRRNLEHMRAGDAYVHLARGYGSAVLAQGCAGVRVENVTVHASPGLAVGLVGNRGAIVVRGLEVRFAPGTTRLLTTNADGVHGQQNRAGPVIEHSYFEGMADDAINLYAPPNVLLEVRSARQWLVSPGALVFPGDRLQVLDPQTGRVRGEVKTQEVKLEQRAFLLTLEAPLESAVAGADHRSADTLYNLDACGAGFLIRRNHMNGNRRYGCLLRAGQGVVEDNLFADTTGAGLVLTNEPDWPEGPVPWAITVRRNRFLRGGTCLGYADSPHGAALMVRTTRLGHGLAEQAAIRDVVIADNEFTDRAGTAVFVGGARNVTLEGNRVHAGAGVELRRSGAAILIEQASAVVMSDNAISDERSGTIAAVEIGASVTPGDGGVRISALEARIAAGVKPVLDRRSAP